MSEQVVPHDPAWTADFEAEAGTVRAALPGVVTELHHMGSTSIPGILAKPIIDMIGGVASLAAVDREIGALVAVGYEAMGEYGIAGRRYFRKTDASGRRTHHLHLYAARSGEIARHLAFRDYLRAHPGRAADYSDLKAAIIAGEAGVGLPYAEAKAALVWVLDGEASAWAADANPANGGDGRR